MSTSPGTGQAVAVSSAEAFAAYAPRIRGYVLSMVRDPAEADDLTQEVFLRAHRKLPALRDPGAVLPWLYRIATHASYDRLRQRSRLPVPDPLEVSDPVVADALADDSGDPNLDRMIVREEMSDCVQRFLEGLSDSYRQVILLHDTVGLTNPEIATMLGVSTDAVKIRLHRSRRRLQAALEANCEFSRDEENVLVCDPVSPQPE